MTNLTQIEIIKNKLHTTGEVSRNFALRNFISRLGAIIDKLKKEGYDFDSFYEEYIDNGGRKAKDYVYKLKKRPELKLFKKYENKIVEKNNKKS